MSNTDTVRRFTTAIEKGDRTALDQVLASNFRYDHKAMDAPLDRNEFIDMAMKLHDGLPDFRFNLSDIKEGNPVKATMQITATHTGSLHVPPLTERPVTATGQRVKMPQERCSWTVENDRIVAHVVERVPNGGPTGILQQIGAPIARAH